MFSGKSLLSLGALVLIVVVVSSLAGPEPVYAGTSPFIGEIIMFGGNFAPRSWALCDGQLLSVSSNAALFSILGTTYGGDGRTTFALPDMRGRAPVHAGTGSGLTNRRLGAKFGAETHTLTVGQMPAHTHSATTVASASLRADTSSDRTMTEGDPTGNSLGYGNKKIYSTGSAGTAMHSSSIDLSVGVTVGSAGSGQSFSLSQPSLVVNFIIAVQGTFPSRN